MLATIFRSKTAITTSIAIMDAFVSMRKYISSNLLNQRYYNNMTVIHDSEIKLLQNPLVNSKKIRRLMKYI